MKNKTEKKKVCFVSEKFYKGIKNGFFGLFVEVTELRHGYNCDCGQSQALETELAIWVNCDYCKTHSTDNDLLY